MPGRGSRALERIRALFGTVTRPLGFELVPVYRGRLLAHYGIDLVFDVGANEGQHARELRSLGYRGRIVSCEPLAAAFHRLAARAAKDPRWTALPLALGEAEGERSLLVASNSVSSSLLEMLPRHLEAAPESAISGSERVKVTRLDAIFDDHVQPGDQVFLKLDVQGYERQVLRGAEASLQRVRGLQLELSLVPLYQGESLFPEMLPRILERGFRLVSMEPAFRDVRSGQWLAVDATFFRDGPRVASDSLPQSRL